MTGRMARSPRIRFTPTRSQVDLHVPSLKTRRTPRQTRRGGSCCPRAEGVRAAACAEHRVTAADQAFPANRILPAWFVAQRQVRYGCRWLLWST